MIVRTPTGNIVDGDKEVTKRNAGDGFVQGLEMQVEYELTPSVIASASFTWVDGEVETYPTSDPVPVKEPLDRLMPPTGRVGLRWEPTKEHWIEGSCSMASDADELSTRDESDTSRIPPGGTPGYTVFHLRAGWNVSEDLALSAAVENIGDDDYRIHGSGVNEPGRNLVLAADMTF